MSSCSRPSARLAAALLLGGILGVTTASAQTVRFGEAYHDPADTHGAQAPSGATGGGRHGGEHYHARGHRAPPQGYQAAPSVEFENGPDPDHLAKIERDKTTGANLTPFGSAYQNSNPVQEGTLGDATGNGWVAPRGNGW